MAGEDRDHAGADHGRRHARLGAGDPRDRLGDALAALARARPRAVGLDVVLPDRSYDVFAPGADQALITGVVALRRVAPVVLGLAVRADGTPRPVHAPLIAAAGRAGFAVLPQDDDGRIRRYDEQLDAGGGVVPTLVGEMARVLGTVPERGLIQYALGEGYGYVPLRDLLRWAADGRDDELALRFGGRPVLVGAVLPFEDRKRQPVPLARWERTLDVPGVLVHAQALRTALAGATVREAPWPVTLALLVVPRRCGSCATGAGASPRCSAPGSPRTRSARCSCASGSSCRSAR